MGDAGSGFVRRRRPVRDVVPRSDERSCAVYGVSQQSSSRLSVLTPVHGFDNKANVVWVVALAVVIMVRPRELNFLRLLPFLLPLLVLSFFLASRTVSGLRSVRVPFSIVLLLSYFATTTAWSAVPVLSVAELLVVFSVAGTACVVSSFGSLREIIGGVLLGCLAVLAASVALGVALPSYGLVQASYQAGSLRGIMTDRNSLSFILVIGLIATLVYEFRGKSARLHRGVLAVLFFCGVLWTTSSTCLILAVVAVLLAIELALIRRVPQSRRRQALLGGALASSAAALYVVANFDELLLLVDRDPTFTGRTAVWPAVENLISTAPWLGQGWGAAWGNESLRLELARSIGFDVPHAHNGYLDLQLQVGAVGLGSVLLVLVLVVVKGVAYYLRSDSPLSSWAIIVAVVLSIYNRVETSFPAPFTLFLMFATLVALGVRSSLPHDAALIRTSTVYRAPS